MMVKMQKSFLERVFPKPNQPLLPQHDNAAYNYQDEEASLQIASLNSFRLSSKASTQGSGRKSNGSTDGESASRTQLRSAPLSASIIHHDDPFLAVDRAAASLQQTIQSLLDFQSQALGGRTTDGHEEVDSQRSVTPTPSAIGSSMRDLPHPRQMGVVPVRQPRKKRKTLRGARNGLGKCMEDFAVLKEEELRITQAEKALRRAGIEKISRLDLKREAVQNKILSLQTQAGSGESAMLRQKATAVEGEIRQLEDRLTELKARHRHLLDSATQIENAAESEMSSFKGTLTILDKDTLAFLQRPTLKQSLGPRRSLVSHAVPGHMQDMYSLRPERRTTAMAKLQWIAELDILEKHEAEIEQERNALVKGGKIWADTVERVNKFESMLRQRMKDDDSSSSEILMSLDSNLLFLHEKLSQADSHNWNLLVCAIGAELEAFRQARTILAPDEPLPDYLFKAGQVIDDTSRIDEDDSDVPHDDLLGGNLSQMLSQQIPTLVHVPSPGSSNESLKATLTGVAKDEPSRSLVNSKSISRAVVPEHKNFSSRQVVPYNDSEDDDDPGPDFLTG